MNPSGNNHQYNAGCKPSAGVLLATAAVILGLLLLGSWGARAGSRPAQISITARAVGKAVKFGGVPSQTTAGLLRFQLVNRTSTTPGVEILRILGHHTASQAFAAFTNPHSAKTPSWVRAEGGVGSVDPGKTNAAILDLPAGKYFAFDYNGGPSPASAQFTLTPGSQLPLPSTTGHVTAKQTGKDKYAWSLGGLTRGKNVVTFASRGKSAIHLILAVPVGKHSLAEVKQASIRTFIHGKPPPGWLDLQHSTDSPALDGGKQQVTQLNLKAGRYAFICMLTDRDGGKPHFLEGLLKEVTIK